MPHFKNQKSTFKQAHLHKRRYSRLEEMEQRYLPADADWKE